MLLFDTGKRLEKAVGEEAAKVIIEALEQLGEEQKRELATKGDLCEETVAIRHDLRETELRLQNEIKNTELHLLKWQIGGWIGLAAIMAKGFGWLGF